MARRVAMTLRLDPEIAEKLDELSQRSRRSRTQQILLFVEQGLTRASDAPDLPRAQTKLNPAA